MMFIGRDSIVRYKLLKYLIFRNQRRDHLIDKIAMNKHIF